MSGASGRSFGWTLRSSAKQSQISEGRRLNAGLGTGLEMCNDIVESNTALQRGGGIYIDGATVYIDSFTVAHTINNTDNSGLNGPTANIDGTYTLKNC